MQQGRPPIPSRYGRRGRCLGHGGALLRACRPWRPARGFVLPVVLVMLMVLTVVASFLIRRGTLDERMAASTRATVTVDTAATYALRYCERWVLLSPPGLEPLPGRPAPPQSVLAPPGTASQPAWRQPSLWAAAVTLNAADLGPEVQSARCLIEDATEELEIAANDPANNAGLRLEDNFRKYRLTVEVRGAGIWTGMVSRAQSELRMFVAN